VLTFTVAEDAAVGSYSTTVVCADMDRNLSSSDNFTLDWYSRANISEQFYLSRIPHDYPFKHGKKAGSKPRGGVVMARKKKQAKPKAEAPSAEAQPAEAQQS